LNTAARRPHTLLQKWLDANGFTSVQLEAVTGIGRQSMSRIRAGGDVRRKTMIRIVKGAARLTGRKVTMDELFDLDPDSPHNMT
jgi:predicted transcriptional regulator